MEKVVTRLLVAIGALVVVRLAAGLLLRSMKKQVAEMPLPDGAIFPGRVIFRDPVDPTILIAHVPIERARRVMPNLDRGLPLCEVHFRLEGGRDPEFLLAVACTRTAAARLVKTHGYQDLDEKEAEEINAMFDYMEVLPVC